MPAPPPPPPPPGPPPPPSAGARAGQKANVVAPDRGALLNSIQQGTRLKKTTTNDRSGLIVGGSASRNPPNNAASDPSVAFRSATNNGVSSQPARLPGIGGLFAGGMPVLKKTGKGVATGRIETSSGSNGFGSRALPLASKTTSSSQRSAPNNFGSTTRTTSSLAARNDNANGSEVSNSVSSSSLNSTPSLTPNASPSIKRNAPANAPPVPPSYAKPNVICKPQHPNSKPPPPPPLQSTSLNRAHSFNVNGGKHDEFNSPNLGVPVPPTRTISQRQTQTMDRRTTKPSHTTHQQSSNTIQRPTRPPPLRPPDQPPPPPPSANPPLPPHRATPAPPPPNAIHLATMKSNYGTSSHVSQEPGHAPTPPLRRNSLQKFCPGQHAEDDSLNVGGKAESFESRFSQMFKAPQFLPPPDLFTNSAKTYPSRAAQFGNRQGSMMKRGPAPPPPAQKTSVASNQGYQSGNVASPSPQAMAHQHLVMRS